MLLWRFYVAGNNNTYLVFQRSARNFCPVLTKLGLLAKCPKFLPDFDQIWEFPRKFFLWRPQFQITGKSVLSKPHRCVRTDTTKLISPFCDCANTSDKCRSLRLLRIYRNPLKREICPSNFMGPCERGNKSLTSIKWGISRLAEELASKKKKVKVLCSHCFPISERGLIVLWKVPRLCPFARSPPGLWLLRAKLLKEAFAAYI